MSKGEKSAVKVMVRVRPFNRREYNESGEEVPTSIVLMNESEETVTLLDQEGCVKDTFEFHKTFWSVPEEQEQVQCKKEFASQNDVYQHTGKPAVAAALAAKHCCIFAYGQTGSGKTFSMLGSQEQPGISPRIVDQVFEELEAMGGRQAGFDFSVEISFMEIYNEKVKDLLTVDGFQGDDDGKRRRSTVRNTRSDSSPTSKRKSANSPTGDEHDYSELKVRNSPNIGVFVEGLTRLGPQEGVATASDVKKVMRAGMEHRATAETNMNATSSRSHAIFQLCVRSKNEAKGIQRYANINLVDLAGSERISLSGAEGSRLVEATKINQSLSTLRRVIDVLIANAQKKKNEPKLVAPYRDSTLTWILSESLGGNSVTMMLATVSPFEGNREDTVNTLRYALKAKSIVNTVRVNEEKGNVVLSAMQREMKELQEQLKKEQTNPNSYMFLQNELTSVDAQKEKAQQAKAETEMKIQKSKEELQRAAEQAREIEEHIKALEEENVEAKKKMEWEHNKRVEEELDQKRQEAQLVADLAARQRSNLEAEMQLKEELAAAKEEIERREMLFRREVQLVKRKQFALAFQKAFSKAGTSSGLECMEGAVNALHEKAAAGVKELAELSDQLRTLERSNDHLKFANTKAAGDYLKSDRTLEVALDAQRKKVSQLADESKAAGDNCAIDKERHRQISAAYAVRTESLDQAKKGGERQRAQVRARIEGLKTGLTTKRELMDQLEEQKEELAGEIRYIEGMLAEEKQRRHEMHNKKHEEALGVVNQRGEETKAEHELSGLWRELDKANAEVASLLDQATRLADVVGELTKNHSDLKKFVSFRFFAAGEYDGQKPNISGMAEAGNVDAGDRVWVGSGCAYRRSGSPPSRSASPLPSPRGGTPSRRQDTPRRHSSRTPSVTPRSGSRVPSRSGSPCRFPASLSFPCFPIRTSPSPRASPRGPLPAHLLPI